MVSLFANDFGDYQEVLEGRGDWQEGSYWLGLIRDYCLLAQCSSASSFRPPGSTRSRGLKWPGITPARSANVLEIVGPGYLDPIAEFANAQLEIDQQRQAPGPGFPGEPALQRADRRRPFLGAGV